MRMKHYRYITLFFACAICFIIQPAYCGDLELTETADQIRVTLRGKPVLEYVKTEKPVPEGIEPHFRRSGYIHPVYTPSGQEISGDFPADHAHQHALFFAWTKAEFDGKTVDFWNQAKDLGQIEFREVAVFCSPKNFRAPQHVRIHPNKPYFCFAPMVEGPFKIEPGQKYKSRYRYLVTSKATDVNVIQEQWDEYAKLEEQ
jgi:Methane oxygenase PmoA